MLAVETLLAQYLYVALGLKTEISPWARPNQLPYFLQDAYEFRQCRICDSEVVLAIDRHQGKSPGRDLRVQLARVAAVAGLPVVYVVNSLASHERRRLVEQKIPFIVPGNQLYLPMLGIDFREYFRQSPQPQNKPLSPATQAILIAALMRKAWLTEWAPEGIAAELGYGPMTSSRAAQELTASRIAAPVAHGRRRLLRLDRPPAEVWEGAQPVLRSPVKRSVWVANHSTLPHEFVPLPAGQSALALYSTISEPGWPIYAVGAAQWNKTTRHEMEIVPDPGNGASEWQIWTYNPQLAFEAPKAADPLSLALSFRDSTDERIQIALDELKGRFPWSEA